MAKFFIGRPVFAIVVSLILALVGAVFVAGGGRYSVKGNRYTEHLEYCSARDWEGHDFTFNLTFKGDTLIQNGIEQVESAGVNRVNIEKYVKIRKQ